MPFLGRESVTTSIINQIEKNFEYLFDYREAPLDVTSTKSFVQFPVVTGPPGIGKSTIGRQLPNIIKNSNTKVSKLPIISIKISCHSSESYCVPLIDSKIEPNYALGARIFWSYFVRKNKEIPMWQAFVEFLRRKFKGSYL